MNLLILAPTTLKHRMPGWKGLQCSSGPAQCVQEQVLKPKKWLLLLNIFSKLSLVLLWVEDLFWEVSNMWQIFHYVGSWGDDNGDCFLIFPRFLFSSTFILFPQGCNQRSWGQSVLEPLMKKIANFLEFAAYFPSHRVSDSGRFQESSRIDGTQSLVLGRAKPKRVPFLCWDTMLEIPWA